jgi:signal transduction histidine kinase
MHHRTVLFRHSSSFLAVGILSFVYYLTADFGLKMDAVSGFATLFWLPAGISLAALLLFGYRLAPGILIGAFLINVAHGAPIPVAVGIALGNMFEAVTATYLLRRFMHFENSFETVRSVLGFSLLAAGLSTLISATVGVSSLALADLLTSPYSATWIAWWIGDMLSILITTPFLLTIKTVPYRQITGKRLLELLLLAGTVVSTGIVIFFGLNGISTINYPLTYIVFPPLIWAALRFGQPAVIIAIFTLSLFAVWGTSQGHGPFGEGELHEGLLFLQSFIGVFAVTAMVLAAVVAERQALEKRKDDFINFASHELRTPITSIKGFTQTLKKIFSDKHEQQPVIYLMRMEQELNKLIGLINDMLDISKIQSGDLAFRVKRFSLLDLIHEAARNTESSRIRILSTKRNSPVVHADRERIGQVLNNLLSNALKYSLRDKSITISMKMRPDGVIVSVSDKGIGITKHHQMKIFDRFYRVNNGNARVVPGLGIGLYLSKMIVKQHGGDIWVKSTIGKGSTFSFLLPLEK